jgi:hypothetical protein
VVIAELTSPRAMWRIVAPTITNINPVAEHAVREKGHSQQDLKQPQENVHRIGLLVVSPQVAAAVSMQPEISGRG